MTHAKKLYSTEVWLDRIAGSWHKLYDKHAVLLVQLPPTMEQDYDRLRWFLDRVPWWVQVAVEMTRELARRRGLQAVGATPGCVSRDERIGLPCLLRATAPFVYVRPHGPSPNWLYGGSYSDEDLAWWADRLREWESSGLEVYAHHTNDGEGHAVRNARRLRELLSY